MADFSNDHKAERNQDFFKEGIHKVKISGITFGFNDADKEYAEITVVDDNGLEDSARIWFTTDAAIGYSFSVLRGIFVHNAPEEKKDATRDAINNLKNTEELEKACQNIKGKECWFSVYKNFDRTYIDKAGNTKPSFDKNIYGYEPEVRNSAQGITEKSKDLIDPTTGEQIFDF